jgi:hypothetical protein
MKRQALTNSGALIKLSTASYGLKRPRVARIRPIRNGRRKTNIWTPRERQLPKGTNRRRSEPVDSPKQEIRVSGLDRHDLDGRKAGRRTAREER